MKIFISYRRSDAEETVGRIFDRLTGEFGREKVFRDIDSIPLKTKFAEHLSNSIQDATLVIVVIGPDWLGAEDDNGNPRLDNPDDFVRIEISTALKIGVPIIPLLVRRAGFPSRDELPFDLQTLTDWNGMHVRPDPDFHSDMSRLIVQIQDVSSDRVRSFLGQRSSIDAYPREVQSLLYGANSLEEEGDVWGAASVFKEASQMAIESGLGEPEQIEELLEREQENRILGELLRVEYRGAPGPALIKAFDDSNEFLRNATKLEVHENGLVHRSALLLVRCGDGNAIVYQRRPEQTYAGKFDFLGGHTADTDNCPFDTARREANEELHLSLNGRRLRVADEWIHQIGNDHQFVWHAPNDRERSTLFVVALPCHQALEVKLTDEAADGIQLLEIPYKTAEFRFLFKEYLDRDREFASGAERIFLAYERDPEIKRQIDVWFG